MGLKIWDATKHLVGSFTGKERVPMQSQETEIPKYYSFEDLKTWIFNSKISNPNKNKILVIDNLGTNIEVKDSNGLINVDVNTVIEDMPAAITEINLDNLTGQSKIKIQNTWITWLVSRIFKSGGVAGDVPIKTNGVNYNWSWGNLANLSSFVTSLLANNSFTNGLANLSSFLTSLSTNIFNGSNPSIQAQIDSAVEQSVNNLLTTPSFQNSIFRAMPIGMIVAWNNPAPYPLGWQPCDGVGGRPNLNSGKYIIGGANNGTVGGNVNLLATNIPTLNSTGTIDTSHRHYMFAGDNDYLNSENPDVTNDLLTFNRDKSVRWTTGGNPEITGGSDITINTHTLSAAQLGNLELSEIGYAMAANTSLEAGMGVTSVGGFGLSNNANLNVSYTNNSQTPNRPESVTMFFIIKVS